MSLSFDPHDSSFNRANALYLAHASDVAYQRAPVAEATQRLGLRAFAFRNKVTRTRGFLGVCETHAVLAFRGTDPVTLPNWLSDVIVKLVEHDDCDGRVHRGFSSALRRTWPMIEPILDEARDVPLFLTGHSMGGALAVLTACRLAKLGRPPVATYTFDSPRVGDRAFCSGYSLPTYRVVNRLDLVPEMPLASMKRLLPAKARITDERFLARLRTIARRVPCYGHVKTFVYLDRDGEITIDADVEPWHALALAHAIATRGQHFLEGIKDHLISSYIDALERATHERSAGKRTMKRTTALRRRSKSKSAR